LMEWTPTASAERTPVARKIMYSGIPRRPPDMSPWWRCTRIAGQNHEKSEAHQQHCQNVNGKIVLLYLTKEFSVPVSMGSWAAQSAGTNKSPATDALKTEDALNIQNFLSLRGTLVFVVKNLLHRQNRRVRCSKIIMPFNAIINYFKKTLVKGRPCVFEQITGN